MKALKTTVLIFASFVLTTQAVRHVYVRYVEPRTSVLDSFDETTAKRAIQNATALSDLVQQYAPARKQVDLLDSDLKKELSQQTRDEYYMYEQKWREDHKQEYERESDLKVAIQDWENRSKEILELRVFWTFGLALFLIGIFLQGRGFSWLGMSLLIPGIVEMIWWTSPSFRFVGSPLEFDRLLNNKLMFTLATIAIILIWWNLTHRMNIKEISNKASEATL